MGTKSTTARTLGICSILVAVVSHAVVLPWVGNLATTRIVLEAVDRKDCCFLGYGEHSGVFGGLRFQILLFPLGKTGIREENTKANFKLFLAHTESNVVHKE